MNDEISYEWICFKTLCCENRNKLLPIKIILLVKIPMSVWKYLLHRGYHQLIWHRLHKATNYRETPKPGIYYQMPIIALWQWNS